MATTLYIRDSTAVISGFRNMLITRGASVTTGVVNTVASGTEIQWTKTAGGSVLEWISGRVPAGGFTLAGTMTFNIWGVESNAQANAGGRVRVFKRTDAGSVTEVGGGPYSDGVEMTTNAAYNWTGTPTSTAFAENDRLICRYYITNAGGTMGGSRTVTLNYDGPTAAASGDSYFQINENVTFKAEDVSVLAHESGIRFQRRMFSRLFARVN